MSAQGLAHRLYRGDAGLNVIGRRKVFYLITLGILVLGIASFAFRGFTLGIDFSGGEEFQVPKTPSVTLAEAKRAVSVGGADVITGQSVGGTKPSYLIKTGSLDQKQAAKVKTTISDRLNIPPNQISESSVSGAWGAQITQKAAVALAVFLALVVVYLIFRFEWRMAVAAFVSVVHDLFVAAVVYSLVGWEVTPNTVIGLLTILGFSLYDLVVVFDKVHENTRGITASSRTTYAEATNLAVNQTLMRSINTTVIALLPVAGLLFIGAGLLGAGTLKDLGLVLFVGMLSGTYSSIFLAAPVLVDLKNRDPRFRAHTARVMAKRSNLAEAKRKKAEEQAAEGSREPSAGHGSGTDDEDSGEHDDEHDGNDDAERVLAGSAPRPGARPTSRPTGRRRPGNKGGRPGNKRRT
ncbi:MAG: protein translocase subunit SecF [Actinocatenispora sp.]